MSNHILTIPNPPEHNMRTDMQDAQWFKDKIRASKSYAQNLYAAMCSMRFQKLDVMPILKDEYWSASWRDAGGIVADLVGHGDYMDYYCSGISSGIMPEGEIDNDEEFEDWQIKTKYVAEGVVTDEIKEDLKILGWQPVEWSVAK